MIKTVGLFLLLLTPLTLGCSGSRLYPDVCWVSNPSDDPGIKYGLAWYLQSIYALKSQFDCAAPGDVNSQGYSLAVKILPAGYCESPDSSGYCEKYSLTGISKQTNGIHAVSLTHSFRFYPIATARTMFGNESALNKYGAIVIDVSRLDTGGKTIPDAVCEPNSAKQGFRNVVLKAPAGTSCRALFGLSSCMLPVENVYVCSGEIRADPFSTPNGWCSVKSDELPCMMPAEEYDMGLSTSPDLSTALDVGVEHD